MTTKIKTFLLENYNTYPEQISEIRNHGIFGGSISELIYNNDIIDFYNLHEDEIYELINDYAECIGFDSVGEVVTHQQGINDARGFMIQSVAVAIDLAADQILCEREQESEAA